MAKNKGPKTTMPEKDVTDAEQALARARKAASRLKPKNEALYWAMTAQTLVLTDIRDMLREARDDNHRAADADHSGSREQAESPDEADSRNTASGSSPTASSSTSTRKRQTRGETAKSTSTARSGSTAKSTSATKSASSRPRSASTRNSPKGTSSSNS